MKFTNRYQPAHVEFSIPGTKVLKGRDIKENELFRIKFEDTLLGIGFADFEKREIGIKCVINNI